VPGEDVGAVDAFGAGDGSEVDEKVLEDSRTRAKEEVKAVEVKKSASRREGSESRTNSPDEVGSDVKVGQGRLTFEHPIKGRVSVETRIA
jgi:hypothetical protein